MPSRTGMPTKITRKNLNILPNTPASASKIWIWDDEITCFGAYKNSKGRVTFAFQYRMPGDADRRIRNKLLGHLGEVTVEQARAHAAELAALRRRGIDPVGEERRLKAEAEAATALILSNYAEDFLRRRAAKGEPYDRPKIKIVRKDIVGHLGDKRIDQITVEDVEDFGDAMFARAESAKRMGWTYLQTILNDAKRRGKIVHNVMDQVDIPEAGERDRVLTAYEIKRFLEGAADIGDCRGDIYELIIRLNKRKQEIASMRWEELDLPKEEWKLPRNRAKDEKPHLVLLPRQAIEIIERQQPDPKLRKGFVFTLNGGRTSPSIDTQMKERLDANIHRRQEFAEAAGADPHVFEHFTVHDGRTGVSTLLQQKPFRASKDLIDVTLLHAGGTPIADIYARYELETEAQELLQQWNDWLDAFMAEPDAFPGGRDLPRMKPIEVERRVDVFRKGWAERAHQVAARERREAEAPAVEGPPRGRKAREKQAYRKRKQEERNAV